MTNVVNIMTAAIVLLVSLSVGSSLALAAPHGPRHAVPLTDQSSGGYQPITPPRGYW